MVELLGIVVEELSRLQELGDTVERDLSCTNIGVRAGRMGMLSRTLDDG